MLKDILSNNELKNYDGLSKKDMKEMLSKVYPGGEEVVKKMLELIGDNPNREGLLDTPYRVVKSWLEIFGGYREDPKKILSTFFEEGLSDNQTDEIIICRDISYFSTCEHHMIPFFGKVSIGYLPSRRVIGLSKLARLVDCISRRLQIQEKLTSEISDCLMEHLQPLGVGVVVSGKHLCMCARGAKNHSSEMITSAMRGKFKTQQATRNEFLQLIKS